MVATSAILTPWGEISPRRRLSLWVILVSLCAHLLALPLLGRWFTSVSHPLLNDAHEVVIHLKPPPTKGQVVDLNSREGVTDKAVDSSFLAEANRQVAKQTQARDTGLQSQAPQASKAQTSPRVGTELGQRSTKAQQRPQLNTDLSPDFLAALAPRAPSNYLPDISLGDETVLSTREFAHAGFYTRMKRQMERVWSPQTILERIGGPPAAEFRTVVAIALRPDGSLADVRVITPSGQLELDREALRAVRGAAPFINPPKELVDADGVIRIPQWHFIVTQRPRVF